MDIPSKPRFLKPFVYLVATLGIAFGVAMFCFENSVVWNPRAPQPALGKILPYPFKGAIFYVTDSELLRIKIGHYGFFACWGVLVFVWIAISLVNKKNRTRSA